MRVLGILAGASLIACLSLAGCTNDESVDPPKQNEHAKQRVQLHVTAPAGLNLRVGATYRIGFWLGMFGGGGEYCGPDVHTPPDAKMHPRPGVTVPIDLRWDGRAYEGEFYIDRFLPGRCHWRFFNLDTLSPANDSVSRYSEYKTNYNFDASHSRGAYDESPIQSTDLWCGADPSPRESENGKMLCTSLNYFVLYPGIVSNELLASVPVDQRDHEPNVNLFPFTKSVTLRYHDLDAENRDAVSSALHRDVQGRCPDYGVRIYVSREGLITVNGTQVARADFVQLVQYLKAIEPAPKLACVANAAPVVELPSEAAMTAFGAVEELRLPLALYTDSSFTAPAMLKGEKSEAAISNKASVNP
jgi:hypothetical protein